MAQHKSSGQPQQVTRQGQAPSDFLEVRKSRVELIAEPYQDGAPNPEMINFTIRNEQTRELLHP